MPISQRAFIEAGADIILTNTFGGTRYRLQLHKAADRVAELNEAAARIARREADRAGTPRAGRRQHRADGRADAAARRVGSRSGERRLLREQAAALARGGADLLWIETMSSVEETEAAIAGSADRRICRSSPR